jgi:hypothetical protein
MTPRDPLARLAVAFGAFVVVTLAPQPATAIVVFALLLALLLGPAGVPLRRILRGAESIAVRCAHVDALPQTGGDRQEGAAALIGIDADPAVRKRLVEVMRYADAPHSVHGLRLGSDVHYVRPDGEERAASELARLIRLDLMQALAGHLDGQAQQARVFGVAFHPAKLDEAQRPRTGFPVDGQWRQTQQAELLGWQVRPGMRRGRRFACRSFGIWRWCLRGWVFAHGRPVYRSVAFDALSAIFLSTGANEGQDPFAQRTGQG